MHVNRVSLILNKYKGIFMKKHIMGLNPEAIELIKNGTKTIEMRLYDERRQEILKDDYISFVSTEDDNNIINTKVKELYRYNSFDELYKEFNKMQLGYSKYDSAIPGDMEKYYSKENIQKYGVIGIEVEVIS